MALPIMYRMLEFIGDRKVTSRELIDRFTVDSKSVNFYLHKLREKDWIESEKVEGKKQKLYFLTSKGRKEMANPEKPRSNSKESIEDRIEALGMLDERLYKARENGNTLEMLAIANEYEAIGAQNTAKIIREKVHYSRKGIKAEMPKMEFINSS